MTADIAHLFDMPNVLLIDGIDTSTGALAMECASAAGHAAVYLSYPGSGLNPNLENVFEINFDHLKEANRYLLRANKNMHRSWPRQNMATDNCLRRDLWMVRWAHALYVVGLFTQDASLLKINTDVAWSAQMYVDRFLYDQEPMDLCQLYMFDIKSEAWWRWQGTWQMCRQDPRAEDIYSVVGQEKLTNASKDAIRQLYAA